MRSNCILLLERVSFENISFRFGKVGPNQLDDVSVEIEPGKFVGIVGQSGSGKSTLMKLLRGFGPDKGRILIDDYDISKVDLKSVRRQVGIVPQDSLLFEELLPITYLLTIHKLLPRPLLIVLVLPVLMISS